MELPFILKNLFIIFAISVAVLFVCHKIKVPGIVGFLITGVLIGPYGFGLVEAVHEVEVMAETGVVLLLFTIGLEFSIKEFLKLGKSLLLGGSVQVFSTVLIILVAGYGFGFSLSESLFLGFLVSLSSTAIVLKQLEERAEVYTPHGGNILGISIFQDLILVPMMLLTPFLSGAQAEAELGSRLWIILLESAGLVAGVIALARWVVPAFLHQVARTRSRELFLLSIIVICFAVAGLTYKLGLSLPLGAFLAGLIISESEYSRQAVSNILPFRDIFTSLFFVSIGMLLNTGFVFDKFGLVIGVAASILVLKVITASGAALVLGYPLRTVILTALALCQVGEFSFVLADVGLDYNLLTGDLHQLFIAVSVLSMAATPFLIAIAPRAVDVLLKLPLPVRLTTATPAFEDMAEGEMGHLVIVGFGINGRNLARAAEMGNIPYVIIELNPDTVRQEKKKGLHIHYGDATYPEVLHQANISEAKVLAVVIHDPAATRRVVELARRLNPEIHIIARTPFVKEVEPLYELGADEVIPEEFETSIGIFSSVLREYLVPHREIEDLVNQIRDDNYGLFSKYSTRRMAAARLKCTLPDVNLRTFRIEEDAAVAGKTLGEVNLRKTHGFTVLVIQRGSGIIPNPGADDVLDPGDIVVVACADDKTCDAAELFQAGR